MYHRGLLINLKEDVEGEAKINLVVINMEVEVEVGEEGVEEVNKIEVEKIMSKREDKLVIK